LAGQIQNSRIRRCYYHTRTCGRCKSLPDCCSAPSTNHIQSLGLDDLRDYTRVLRGPLPIYVRSKDFEPIRQKFPYLVNTARATGSLFVAQLDFRTYDTAPFDVEGLTITPFVRNLPN